MPLARKISKHTSTNKQPQWRRRCETEKTKVEEEGVIDPRTMTNVSNIFFMSLCSANYLSMRSQ